MKQPLSFFNQSNAKEVPLISHVKCYPFVNVYDAFRILQSLNFTVGGGLACSEPAEEWPPGN